jgi:hypothetical protein
MREENVCLLGLVRIEAERNVITERYKLLITALAANNKSDSSGLTDCGPVNKKILNLVQRFLDDPTFRINNYFTSNLG